MKLYNILFEQQLKLLTPEQMKAPESAYNHLTVVKPNTSNYSTPEYAMVTWSEAGETGFVLFHVRNFKKALELQTTNAYESYLCAYAGTTEEHYDDCSGAVEISYMVRSPQYPGAGGAMYALVSDYFGKPITSDRQSSTSDSAKKAWARIETDPNWSKNELDNWIEDANYDTNEIFRKWFKFDGTWPNRVVKSTDEEGNPEEAGPRTPNDESDDCKLPDKVADNRSANKYIGTGNAWSYNGPLNAHDLIDQASVEFTKLAKVADERTLMRTLKSNANSMFLKYYKGVGG